MAAINTLFRLTDEMSPALNKINVALGTTLTKMLNVNTAMSIFSRVISGIKRVSSEVDSLVDTYMTQYEQEVKLYSIMSQRMGATADDYTSVYETIKKESGIFNDQLLYQGAQEIATFVETREQIEALIPAIANLTAQQYGMNATGNNMRQVATLLGRMLNGNTNGLNKLNLAFTENEKKILKNGDMNQRMAIILDKVQHKVGDMNQILLETNVGKIQFLENKIQDLNEDFGKILQPIKLFRLSLNLLFKELVFTKVEKSILWIKNNLDGVKTALTGLVVIAGTVGTALAAAWAVANWPLALLISGLYLVIRWLTKVGFAADEIFAGFVGAFTALGTILQDFFVVCDFVFVTIYNLIASIVDLIGGNNSWKSVLADIANIGLTLVQVFTLLYDVVNSVVVGIGRAVGFSNLAVDNFTGKINELKTKIDSWGDVSVKQISMTEWKPIINTTLDSIDGGLSFFDDISKWLDWSFEDEADIKSILEKFGFYGSSVSTRDDTLIDIAEDYRELLTKRAVQKFNLQMTQLTPSINIDHVDVHKESDAENVLNTVVNALDDFVNSNLSSASYAN